MATPKIAVIVGSTREGRFSEVPAKWIYEIASRRSDLDVEIVDLRDYPMPFFDEPASPLWVPSRDATAQRWQRKLAEFDGFIIIAAEYNRAPPAVLKNALDYAYTEWNKKPVAFVGYGATGGARSIEMLRTSAIELQMTPIRTAVHIQAPVYLAVKNEGKSLNDFDFLKQGANDLLDQLVWWADALKAAREGVLDEVQDAAA